MAKAKKTKVKEPRADQPGITGIGDEYNARVHGACKHYAKMRDARMEATEHEVAAKVKLIEIMTDEGLETYSHKEVDVTLVHGDDNVKVKIGGKPADEPKKD